MIFPYHLPPQRGGIMCNRGCQPTACPQTLAPCGRETAGNCVRQFRQREGEAVDFGKNFTYLGEGRRTRPLPLSLILLLNEAKSVPLPQGARVVISTLFYFHIVIFCRGGSACPPCIFSPPIDKNRGGSPRVERGSVQVFYIKLKKFERFFLFWIQKKREHPV